MMVGLDDIRRIMVWVARSPHSRGFGVQSPWAYRFVRYVINEHYPYYAYGRLASEFGLSGNVRRLFELYFRISNFLRPQLVADCGTRSDAFSGYVAAGCNRARVVACAGVIPDGMPPADMARFSPSPHLRGHYAALAEKAGPQSLFIIEGIGHNAAARRLWREVKADPRTGVTFDLYYCGIVFFDKKRFKQNYIIKRHHKPHRRTESEEDKLAHRGLRNG